MLLVVVTVIHTGFTDVMCQWWSIQEFLVTASPVLKGTIEEKLSLGLRMVDEDDTHMLDKQQLEMGLLCMNRTLGYFADTVSNAGHGI